MVIWDWGTFALYLFIFIISVSLISPYGVRNGYIVTYTRTNEILMLLAFILIWLLLSLRSEDIGYDLINYKSGYLNLQDLEFSLSWLIDYLSIREPTFVIINIFTGYIFNWNFQGFIIVTALIQIIFAYKTFKKLNDKKIALTIPFAFYMCFIYIRSFSMVRQSMAMSVVLYAYTFLEEKNYKKFWIYSLIAIGIHYTAIVAVVIYFWAKVDKLRYFKRIMVIISILLVLVFGELILTIIFEKIGEKYALMDFNSQFGWGNILIRLPLLILLFINIKEMRKEYPGVITYFYIYLLDIFIAQFKYLNVQFERITLYTSMSLLFILPILYKVLRKKYGVIVSILFPAIFLLWFIYNIYYFTNINPYNIMPYKISFLNQ